MTQETTDKGTLIDHFCVQFYIDCEVIPTYFSDHEGHPVWAETLTIIGRVDTRLTHPCHDTC